jgi:hypothetical protein
LEQVGHCPIVGLRRILAIVGVIRIYAVAPVRRVIKYDLGDREAVNEGVPGGVLEERETGGDARPHNAVVLFVPKEGARGRNGPEGLSHQGGEAQPYKREEKERSQAFFSKIRAAQKIKSAAHDTLYPI